MQLLKARNQVLLVAAENIVVYKVRKIAHLIHYLPKFDVVLLLVLVNAAHQKRI